MKFETFVEDRQYTDFVSRLKAAVDGYAELEEVGPLYKVIVNPQGTTTLCFVAGIHGDEEAGPYGILSFLEDHMRVPPDLRLVIIPLVNPAGYEKDKRRNADNKDINRHFLDGKPTKEGKLLWKCVSDEKIKLAVTLHEHPTARHFYLYYTGFKKLAELIRDAGAKYFTVKQGPKISRDKGDNGLIPPPHGNTGAFEDKLTARGVPYFTTEPPGTETLARRVKFMKEVIKLVIHNFDK